MIREPITFPLNANRQRPFVTGENSSQRIPIIQLRQEVGAYGLATSPEMNPYLEFIKAVMLDHDHRRNSKRCS